MTYEKVESKNSSRWTPVAIGDQLEGTVEELAEHQEFGLYAILTLEDGSSIETPCHKVLQNLMFDVVVGDKIKIVYTEEVLPKVQGRNPTKIYELFIDKDSTEEVVQD